LKVGKESKGVGGKKMGNFSSREKEKDEVTDGCKQGGAEKLNRGKLKNGYSRCQGGGQKKKRKKTLGEKN